MKPARFANELQAFMATIPYNLYALLTIFMVIIMLSVIDLDFGTMEKEQIRAEETGDLGAGPHDGSDRRGYLRQGDCLGSDPSDRLR